MYQLVSAVVKPLGGNARWRSMDIGNIPLTDLFSGFAQVIAVLSNPFLTDKVALDLETMRAAQGGSNVTFNEFLLRNGTKTLPTGAELPAINTRYVKFADAFHAGYTVTPTPPSASSTSNMPAEEKTWALLTKPNLDYEFFYKRCLVNVNGFYHQTDYSADGVFVVDAMKSVRQSGRNEVGILSFMEVGEIEFIPITDAMIYKQRDTQKLKNNCYVETGVDLSKKTVMLVLGGYLHVLDQKTLKRVSTSAFSIDFSNIQLIDRYFESHNVVDLSSLGMESTTANADQISVPDLFSDEVLRKYLQLSQTFFVVLNNPEIFIDNNVVTSSPSPGVYYCSELPQWPLVVGAGRHETYWVRKEWGQHSLSLHPKATWEGQRNFKTVQDQHDLLSVDNAQQLSLGYRNANAQFLLIGSDI